MKKIIAFCFLFGFFNTANALFVEEMSISPISGTNDINVYVKSKDFYIHSFNSESYSISGSNIIIYMCYNPGLGAAITYTTRNVVIPNINTGTQNYTITVNLCYYRSGTCRYNDIKDTRSISFTTPLTSTLLETVNQSDEKPFNVFPNPAKEMLYFSNPIDAAIIYDALGRKIIEQDQPANSIPVSELVSGTYIITISTQGKTQTQRFIKQ